MCQLNFRHRNTLLPQWWQHPCMLKQGARSPTLLVVYAPVKLNRLLSSNVQISPDVVMGGGLQESVFLHRYFIKLHCGLTRF